MLEDSNLSRGQIDNSPSDWSTYTLATICKAISDGTHFTPKYVASGVPFYSVENVTANNFRDTKFISEDEHARLVRRCRPERGDLLLTRIGSIGATKLITWDVDASIYVSLALLKLNDLVDPTFVACYTQSHQFLRDIEQRSLLNAIPKKINMDAIGGVPIPLPPTKAEQRAIASALSDADAWIESLERLITKKRQIKQGAMQELLTGKRRLPRFKGTWDVVCLGDHVHYLSHGTNARADLVPNDTVRYLHYGDIHAASSVWIDPDRSELQFLPVHLTRSLDRLRDGDLILVDASEDLSGVGKSVEIRCASECQAVAGLHTIAARFDKSVIADTFKGYLQFVPQFKQQLQRLAAGTKVLATNRKHLSSVEMPLPRVDEQRAIARVLLDMDAELDAMEARLAKARLIKQGMMQQLLTGRIRLVLPDRLEAAAC